MIDKAQASFVGPPPHDQEIMAALPQDYASFLQTTNGCVLFEGGLHVREAVRNPDWHSLRQAWIGEDRFSARQ